MIKYKKTEKINKKKTKKSAALWSFPNLLTKRNKSLAAIVNVFAIFCILFWKNSFIQEHIFGLLVQIFQVQINFH